jgi:hypothetical protein
MVSHCLPGGKLLKLAEPLWPDARVAPSTARTMALTAFACSRLLHGLWPRQTYASGLHHPCLPARPARAA